MTEPAEAYFTVVANALTAGDLNFLANFFILPLPLYLGPSLLVLSDRADLDRAVKTIRRNLRCAGIERLSPQVRRVISDRAGGTDVQVSWQLAGRTDSGDARTVTRCFLRSSGPGSLPRIEMMQTACTACPGLLSALEFADHG